MHFVQGHTADGDCGFASLRLLLGFLEDAQKAPWVYGKQAGFRPCEDVLGPVGVVRGSGDHRVNVFCSTLPGRLHISMASPSGTAPPSGAPV